MCFVEIKTKYMCYFVLVCYICHVTTFKDMETVAHKQITKKEFQNFLTNCEVRYDEDDSYTDIAYLIDDAGTDVVTLDFKTDQLNVIDSKLWINDDDSFIPTEEQLDLIYAKLYNSAKHLSQEKQQYINQYQTI